MKVRRSGTINALGCKIKVPTTWNVELWRELLVGYHDQQIVSFIEYGWPIDANQQQVQTYTQGKQLCNQAGTHSNPAKLDTYISGELDRGGIIGPFANNPLGREAKFSPLDAIPKWGSEDLRIIMNLSFPHDESAVNAMMDKDTYLGESVELKYPSVEDLIKLIQKKGRGSLLFKRDLLKYYRQILLDPGSIHLVGFVVNNLKYFDVVLTMGMKIACFIAQRITNALMFIYKCLSFESINYIDDLARCE